MNETTLQVFGKQCDVYELHLMCECGGHFVADIRDAKNGMYINDEYTIPHTCNKCGKIVYVRDIYPKHTYHPFGEVIRFEDVTVF